MNDLRTQQLLETLYHGIHFFTKIQKSVGWSSNTVSNYLEELKKSGYVKQEFVKDGKVGYFITESGDKFRRMLRLTSVVKTMSEQSGRQLTEQDWIQNFETDNQLIQILEQVGIFNKPVDVENLLPYLRLLWKDEITFPEEFNLTLLHLFLRSLPRFYAGDVKIKGSLQFCFDPKQQIKENQKIIESIKITGLKDRYPIFP